MAETLEVFSGGEILEGWKSVSVSQAFDRMASSFALSLAEIEPDDPRLRKLKIGATLEFHLDGELVLSGIVRKRTKRYDGVSNSVEITGRDLTVDLVDCSATNEPGEWNGARLDTIAAELVGPFPLLKYRADLSASGLGSATTFDLETGESVFAALDRLARMRGFLVDSDLAGGVFFTRPGENRAPVSLELGTNIEAGQMVEDESERFSTYIFHAQASSVDSWEAGSGPGMAVRVETKDPGVTRFRPLVTIAEESAGEAELQKRADFDASVRAARSVVVSYTLPGWKLDGYLWKPGELVPVFDPMLAVGTEGGSPVDLLIGSVEWSRDAGGRGSTTKLELFKPGTFATKPIKAPKTEALELWDL